MPDVATYTQFCDALKTMVSGTVINIVADLDANDYQLETSITCPLTGDAVTDVTINGNGHNVYNITSFSGINSDGIFRFSRNSNNININNINFLNCYITGKKSMFGTLSNDVGKSINFNQCVFQGRFSKTIAYGGQYKFNDCMITARTSVGENLTGYTLQYLPKYNRCWIRLDNCIAPAMPMLRFLRQCYVEGNITPDTTSNPIFCYYANNSCINLTMDVLNGTTLQHFVTFDGSYASDSYPNIINIDTVTGIADTTGDDHIKGVTTEQMRDANYLASIGFDILIP